MGLKSIELPQKVVAEDKIGKDSESFDFASDQREHEHGVAHALDVAYVGPIQVEHL